METSARTTSILKASVLDTSITGFQTFDLSVLKLKNNLEIPLPSNVRLGHLAEKVVAGLIKSSTNYKLLYENIQIIEAKKTIGEIDFIVENKETKQQIHIEFAYKFYLYDPHISSKPLDNWIGPNRNDSLKEKLKKLKTKQFPLLYHNATKLQLKTIEMDKVSQVLCLLASLFIPYNYKGEFSVDYKKCIHGYYINYNIFIQQDNLEKNYYIPTKKEWGLDPSENKNWKTLSSIEKLIRINIEEKQSILFWQKYKEAYSTFFVVWW